MRAFVFSSALLVFSSSAFASWAQVPDDVPTGLCAGSAPIGDSCPIGGGLSASANTGAGGGRGAGAATATGNVGATGSIGASIPGIATVGGGLNSGTPSNGTLSNGTLNNGIANSITTAGTNSTAIGIASGNPGAPNGIGGLSGGANTTFSTTAMASNNLGFGLTPDTTPGLARNSMPGFTVRATPGLTEMSTPGISQTATDGLTLNTIGNTNPETPGTGTVNAATP